MSDTCTYCIRGMPPCPEAATHRVVRAWDAPGWTVEEGGQESAYTAAQVRSTGIYHGSVVVGTQRNGARADGGTQEQRGQAPRPA